MKNAWIIKLIMTNIIFRKEILHCTQAILLLTVAMITPAIEVKAQSGLKSLGRIALEESLIPIRPGEPGKTPFWNEQARQFIHAPAFDYKIIPAATSYRYKIFCISDSSSHVFESNIPYDALSKVWASMPVGYFDLEVSGISVKNEFLGVSGKGHYYRAASFNGPYHDPVIPYDQSAMIALDNLLKKDYVEYWIKNKAPHPKYVNYRFPAKIFSALIIGAITHARLKPNTADAVRSSHLARIIADYLISISFKEGTPWEYFPPTYYGNNFGIVNKPHMNVFNNFTIMGVDAGNAYLDLYDYTSDKKYLEAAKRIAATYLKTQLENGSWYQFVNHATGKPTAPNITIPTSVINYFDRLQRDYHVSGLKQSSDRALNWILQNPVKTFNWQGQFEDIEARAPYKNQSREQSCDMAIYLFKNNKDINLAEELVRFSEDQFVIWEKPLDIAIQQPRPGGNSKNWITPSVQEQYTFFMPVGRAAGLMVETYWQAYKATKKEIYLEKAKSIANSFTVVQKEHNGDYPTFFTKYPMNLWLNSTVYPAKVLTDLNNNIKSLNGLN